MCESCFYQKYKIIDEKLSVAESIRTYPSTYKGQINIDESTSDIINTGYYRDRDNALFKLKCYAVLFSKDVITEIEYTSRTESDGNYKYKTWMCEGKASNYI